MAFAVNIYFNPQAESLLRAYFKKFDAADLPNKSQRAFCPHITLCIYEEINCLDCECQINEISSQAKPAIIKLDHIGIFNNGEKVLFLAPAPNECLLALQRNVFQALSDFSSNPWKLYQPDHWVPHCTLANDLDEKELIDAIEISLLIPLPIQTQISQIGIIEFDPIQPIFQVDIKE